MPSNWWVDTQPGPTFPGGATVGGGGNAAVINYRSPLDAARAAKNKIPGAEYPDGYLGTITDRREDRLLERVQEKLTERSYQRGVHKGSKIDNQDYFWPSGYDPMRRIRAEASYVQEENTMNVVRYKPTGNPVEKLSHLGKPGLTPPEQIQLAKQYGVSVAKNPVVIQDPTRVARMQKMLPRYAM